MTGLAAALCLGVAVWLATSPPAALPARPATAHQQGAARGDLGWPRRHRWLWALLAGTAALTFVGGVAGVVAFPLVAGTCWVVAGRAEPRSERRRREAVRHDLPHVVALVAAGLRSGADPVEAVSAVCRAFPGPAADALTSVAARLRLGGDPVAAWSAVAADPDLGPFGRAMVRAQRSGAPVTGVIDRLSDELARSGRAAVEDRARAVGVKAAVPLGLCLLPAFLLIGIVPLVAGLLSSLAW